MNRANPYPHKGMIYCSNLCTEIAQNMSAISTVETKIQTEDKDTVVVYTTKAAELVVCNLASLALVILPVIDPAYVRKVVRTVVRALDNVIDLNFYPVPYAKITNHTYRSIGLGVSGYHHMLAKNGSRKNIWRLLINCLSRLIMRPLKQAVIMRKKKVLTDILKDRTGRAEPILKSVDTARMSGRS